MHFIIIEYVIIIISEGGRESIKFAGQIAKVTRTVYYGYTLIERQVLRNEHIYFK